MTDSKEEKSVDFVVRVKDPDLLTLFPEDYQESLKEFFEFGEYFSLLIKVNKDGEIVAGHFRK